MGLENRGYAYNPEGQAIATREAQENNDFLSSTYYFDGFSIKREFNLDWVVMGNNAIMLLDHNFSKELLYRLKKGDELVKISARRTRFPDEQGNLKTPIAAILYKDEILYRSPGFDFESYREGRLSIQETQIKEGSFPQKDKARGRKARGKRKAIRRAKQEARRQELLRQAV